MDYGRKNDLEDLAKLLQRGDLSTRARAEIEETMHKIANQSAPITSLRERLIRATRAGDVGEIRKIQHHIQKVRQDETYGREW